MPVAQDNPLVRFRDMRPDCERRCLGRLVGARPWLLGMAQEATLLSGKDRKVHGAEDTSTGRNATDLECKQSVEDMVPAVVMGRGLHRVVLRSLVHELQGKAVEPGEEAAVALEGKDCTHGRPAGVARRERTGRHSPMRTSPVEALG